MAASDLDATSFEEEPDSLAKVSVGRQALRREVNERIAALSAGWGRAPHFEAFCECGRAKCADRTTVAPATYEELRRVPTHFLVKLGHANRSDRIVGEHAGFVIVEKFGTGGIEALSLDRKLRRSA